MPQSLNKKPPTYIPKDTPLEIWQRGARRDADKFPILSDDRYNADWHRSFEIQATAQDLSNVLNPNYKPPSSEEALFKKQNEFIFSVFDRVIKTDHCRSIVKDYADKKDAQKAYAEILEYHTQSRGADIESSQLMAYLTTAKLGPTSSWKGTTKGFILHWYRQLKNFERMATEDDKFSDNHKLTMLGNAVAPIPELNAVKDQNAMHTAHGAKSINFDTYYSLLLSAATAYDHQLQNAVPPRHQVRYHDLVTHDDQIPDNDFVDVEFDSTTPIDVINAHATLQ